METPMWGRWLSFVMPENKMKGDINEKHKLLSEFVNLFPSCSVGERHEARRGRADLGDREVDHHLPIKYDQKFVQFVQLAEQFKVARVCKGLCEDNFSDKLNFSMKLCNNATSWNRILISQNILDPTCSHQRKKLSNILL